MVRLAGLCKSGAPTLLLTVCGAQQHPSSFPSSRRKAAHCVVHRSRILQSPHKYTRTTKASSSSSVAENWSEVAWDFFPRQDKLMVAACLGINVLSVISYVLVAPCLGRVIDVISNSSSYGALAKAVGALTLAYIVSNSTLAAQVRLASCVGERVASRVRSKLFGTMMWTDHSVEADSGTMMSWLSNDVQVLQTTITKLLGARGIRSGLETIGIICVLMWLNWVLALMLLISAPVLTPLVLSAAAKIKSLSENVQASTAQTSSAASEIIENQKIIRVNQAEDAQIDRFRGLVDEQSRVNTQLIVYQSLLDVSGRLRNVFCVLLTVGLGAHLALMNQVSIGTCYSFFIYGFGFAFALSNVAQSIGEVFKVVGTMKQVMSHFMSDISSSRKQTSSENNNNLIRSGLDGITVEFRNVSFTHKSSSSSEEGDSWSMENLNFTMPAHTTTALVGPSGGGKSTIASLLLGFYKPTSGEIYVDGVPLSEIDQSWWKEQIGMVEQKPGLLVGKVSDVVSYGNEDATREDIVKVLEQTQALNFVNNLPKGLDSLVGGDGIGISGGQAQRLALARALLRKPRLLILDEATSALDVNTESAINIFDASQDDCPTTLVIAHRLNTVRDADNIIVVAHGKIVETGTHDELVSNTDGIYARLVQGNSTFLDEEEHANEENPAAVVVF
ncbi:ABC transporter B family member 1 [Picochlorum sp. SENEW3]|nr:ABC transporter B family member 1 [Picochlorum sp. SENEW3]